MPDMTRGLVMVHTGPGKGKTTAALGLMLRAWGQGLRVGMIQFIKAESGRWGEVRAAERLGWEWHTLGSGFVWDPAHPGPARERAEQAWALAQERLLSGALDLLVLDEFTYPLHFGWLPAAEVVAWLRAHKPAALHLCITGRNAPPELLEYADLVSEITALKHPYDAGIAAQKGIEF
jgi:cob(I)alamin adenosyltransferase